MKISTITLLIGLAAATALAGCGRKAVPVTPQPEGQPARAPAVLPDPQGTARAAPITPIASQLSVVPTEISRNPNAEKKRFFLDGILN